MPGALSFRRMAGSAMWFLSLDSKYVASNNEFMGF